MQLWNNLGSVVDTLAFKYVKANMPYSFEKYRIGLLSAYFKEAKQTMTSLLEGLVVNQDDIFKMRMYMKAEHYTLMLNHIFTAVTVGCDTKPPMPRSLISNIPGVPSDVSANLISVKCDLIPSCESDDNVSDSWVARLELCVKSPGGLKKITNLSKFDTLRDVFSSALGSEVASRACGHLFDCSLPLAMQELAKASVYASSSRLSLCPEFEWKMPGKIGLLRYSVSEAYVESVYMNHLADNSFVIHPYAYK